MDRVTIYPGQNPLVEDQLEQSKNAMVALAYLSSSVLGTATAVDGLAVTPTAPASLNVLLTAGNIYQVENLEASDWVSGIMLADTAHTILKQGISLDAVQLAITPPSTTGYSQVYLIEVQYQDADVDPTTLPYFNSTNIADPYSGPGNDGAAQNTMRQGKVAHQVKAGSAATTGTQVAPTPDAGWSALALVTVANGQTSITSGNIVKYAGAPYIPVYLPQVPYGVQSGAWVYAADTGTASNLIATVTPNITSLVAGMEFRVKAASPPTGASVINVNGIGNTPIVNTDGSIIHPNQWAAGSMLVLDFDGTSFQLVSFAYNDLIDGAVTFTVHGTNPNFADLNAAMEYLSKFKITHNGSVTLQLAGSTSGIANVYTYTSNVIVDHPDAERMSILGATLLGTMPTSDASFTLTGSASANRANDNADNIAVLRTVFATELHFTGGTNFQVNGRFPAQIDRLLFTSDASGTNVAGFSSLGLGGGSVCSQGVAVYGFSGSGFQFDEGHIGFGTTGSLIAIGNGASGFGFSNGGGLNTSATLISLSNAQSGYNWNIGSESQIDGNIYALCNASQGISINQATLFCTSSRVWKNGAWGLSATLGTANLIGDFGASGNANVSGSVQAFDGSTIVITTSANVGTCSPAVNTVGNSNSFIVD